MFEPGLGFGSTRLDKAKPGWSGPGQVLVRVLVRHGYDKSQTGVVRSWSGPGSNLVRSMFEPGLGFGSTRLGQSQTGVVRSWSGPGSGFGSTWL